MSVNRLATEPSIRTRWFYAVGLGLACVLVGYLDAVVVSRWSLRLLYLPVIILAAWRAGLPAALVMSLIAALLSLLENGATLSAAWEPGTTWESFVRFAFLGAIAVMASQLARSLKRQRQLASTDQLTGLKNRTAFLEQSEAELNRCRRTGRPLTLAFLDCDLFKEINDSLGHTVGDEVLKTLGDVLRTTCSRGGIAARLGGDEFGLLLPETNADEARVVIERMRSCLRETANRREWSLTLSVGVVSFLKPPPSVSQMIRAADEAMYSVKRTSKDAVHYATADG